MRYADAVLQALLRQGEREISDDAARAIAAAWQSPGTIGCELAAVATGAWVRSRESIAALLDDIATTRQIGGAWVSAEDSVALDMLATWAMNGGESDA